MGWGDGAQQQGDRFTVVVGWRWGLLSSLSGAQALGAGAQIPTPSPRPAHGSLEGLGMD